MEITGARGTQMLREKGLPGVTHSGESSLSEPQLRTNPNSMEARGSLLPPALAPPPARKFSADS